MFEAIKNSEPLRRTLVGSNPGRTNDFGYDAASRLSTVTSGTNNMTYGYLANSSLLSTLTFKQGTTTRMTTTKGYDSLNRLTGVTNTPSADSAKSFVYTYNTANQRTRNTLADGSFWEYEYDSLGQVISGKKRWSDGLPMEGQQFEYAFDNIGNRLTTTINCCVESYTPNSLNQYTQKTVRDAVDVIGTSGSNVTVTVNNQSTDNRKGEYFYKKLEVSNGSSAAYPSITVVGVSNFVGTAGADIVTQNMGNRFVAKTPEQFTYDSDGNLTQDGRWNYSWDAENRLLSMETRADVRDNASITNSGKKKLEFTYDYQGRRIQKKVMTWNGSVYGSTNTIKCVYDGWNKLAEMDGTNGLVRSYVWGNDLSGSPQGAGGVGGLLAVNNIADNSSHFYAYDGNGNVAGLVNNDTGKLSAVYEYGPFGELIRSTGTMAGNNPFKFSTKEQDVESGLLYYGYRCYDAVKGRFVGRDPLEEAGGGNLYGFCKNDGVNFIDFLGLYEKDFHYSVIYFLLRMKCFTKNEATAIASASQGIDENPISQPFSYGQIFSSLNPIGAQQNVDNPELLRYYHFAGSGPNTATQRNEAGARGFTQRQLNAWNNGGEGNAQLTGQALHLYADTWAHEGFTPWPNKKINQRFSMDSSGVFSEAHLHIHAPEAFYRGHADTEEKGHAPDHLYNDIQKALEAARAIYDLIPSRDSKAGPSFDSFSSDLSSKFGNVGSEAERVSSFQRLINQRFGD